MPFGGLDQPGTSTGAGRPGWRTASDRVDVRDRGGSISDRDLPIPGWHATRRAFHDHRRAAVSRRRAVEDHAVRMLPRRHRNPPAGAAPRSSVPDWGLGIDVFEFGTRFAQEFAEPRSGAKGLEIVGEACTGIAHRIAQVAKHRLLRDSVELERRIPAAEAGNPPRRLAAPGAGCRRAAPGSERRSGTRAVPGRRGRAPSVPRFPSAHRSPRPSCWRKTVALSVGRSMSTVSTSGRSTPSLKRSTAKMVRSSPRRSLASLNFESMHESTHCFSG